MVLLFSWSVILVSLSDEIKPDALSNTISLLSTTYFSDVIIFVERDYNNFSS